MVTDYDLDWARELLATVPGLSTTGAENILAETGVDMTAFETPAHLASWTGHRTTDGGRHGFASSATRDRP
ncbi:IS110 family transposase [Rhodococcus sp. 14C212]|nr:IS110 family transposase [Rhodococcus sp. 14C212]